MDSNRTPRAKSPLRVDGFDINRQLKLGLSKDELSPGPGTTALSSFVDLLAFFRSDVEIKGKDVTIARRTLVNEVLRALRISEC